MIYVHTRFKAAPCDHLNNSSVEALFCEVVIEHYTLLLGVVYRPPLSGQDDQLNALLKKVSKTSSSYSFISGDFNHPEIDWEIFRWPENLDEFMNVILDSSWYQMITVPTRGNNILPNERKQHS
jgi:small nuclear ribonucleoprotein (snRNP)-like protein